MDTVIVQPAACPAVKEGVVATLLTARFALVIVELVELPELLAGFGSGVDEPAVAVLVTVGAEKPADSVPSTVTATDPPAGRVPRSQCRAPPVMVQVPVPVLVAVNVTPTGGVSSSTTAAASDGPALPTSTCHRTCPPATGEPETTDLTAEMSADVVTGPVTVAEAVAGLLSKLSERTDAALVIVAGGVADDGSATTRVTVRDVPTGTSGHEQTTGVPGWQVPSFEAVAETSVVPAGIGSVSTRFLALDGPLLVAVIR